MREQGLEVTGAVTLLFEQRLQRVARNNKKSSTEEQKRNRKLTKFRKKLSNQTLEQQEEYGYQKDVGMK